MGCGPKYLWKAITIFSYVKTKKEASGDNYSPHVPSNMGRKKENKARIVA